MARAEKRLSPVAVRNAKEPGMYADGAGLYLRVGPTGSKSWIFRFMLEGRAREMGLGAERDLSLSEARDRATQARRTVRLDGVDPIDTRRAIRTARRVEAAKAVTFRTCMERYIKAHRAAWRNDKHAAQWTSTLETYAFPVIGDLSVSAIDTGHVTAILSPIWSDKAETASRVRGRIEAILDYARTHGWRTGENPARWKGHLENVLPKKSKVSRVEHHAALPWREIASFMNNLSGQAGMGALALQFGILTAARTGEIIGARWNEIDLSEKVWCVPAERMKSHVEHRVPLSAAAVAVLKAASPEGENEGDAFVFSGGRKGKGLSNMALLAVLRRMERGDLTSHGFRSTFRDWAAERTTYQREVAEQALAHTIGDKVEAAYRRGDLFEKRRSLMDDWAEFCSTAPPKKGEVVEMRRA